MALIVCPECGKEISEHVKTCPHCGYPLRTPKIQQIQAALDAKKRVVIGIACCVIILLIGCWVHSTGLNKYEKMALEDCEKLISWMKNPDSFVLYEDILIYPNDEDYGDLVYITYGGTNSYGAMVQSTSAFENGNQYVGDYGQTEDEFDSQHEYDYYLLAFLPYKYDIIIKGNYENFIVVDANKIMKNLK